MFKRFLFLTLTSSLILFLSGCLLIMHIGDQKVGWAIGWDDSGNAVILHTEDGGKTWAEQGDRTLWAGMAGNDISAADNNTAWAALGDNGGGNGAIVNTADGGLTWQLQAIPAEATGTVKGIKALNSDIVWAVTLNGVVLRTMNGGKDWEVIPHPGVDIIQVNRIDAKGGDVWIADVGSRNFGMIHSSDFGQTWRKEELPNLSTDPGSGPMAVSIVNDQTAWAAVRPMADIYRTQDGGTTWGKDAAEISGQNDLDDICAPNADLVWAVQNIGGFSGGLILKVVNNGTTFVGINSDHNPYYQYEGITCFSENEAWAVGFKSVTAPATMASGIIRHTENGGITWETQDMPVDDAQLWKISFVGAHR
ncbi:MAG TPA: YCF48-related protein [Thermotogota bacterium]|nr:YCF48-related protein [Thermotogota bacterium]HPJ88744.1 YCF48-related protein [Thermotogota bacterium]